MKKNKLILMGVMLTSLALAGCSKDHKPQDKQNVESKVEQEVEQKDEQNVEQNAPTQSEKQENKVPTEDENLFDQFLAGEVNAYRNSTDEKDTFKISDLNMNEDEWDAFSVGDRVDLDNDGEDELILNGPYGGMYLDQTDHKVIVFVSGEGTADCLSYTKCDNEVWIVHSDTTHTGREYYKLEKYAGADSVTDSVTLYIDEEDNGDKKYYIDDKEVTESEYNEEYDKFFKEK